QGRRFVGDGEAELALALQSLSVAVVQQMPLVTEEKEFTVDLYLPEYRLVVEVVNHSGVTAEKASAIEAAGLKLHIVQSSVIKENPRFAALDIVMKYHPVAKIGRYLVGTNPYNVDLFEDLFQWICSRWQPT